MGNVANAFSLPFKSADWFPRLLLTGLITLIPVIGWINLVGWFLATLDNYRRGVAELPPAGFQYIGRGVTLFFVGLLWAIVIGIVLGVPLALLTIGSVHTFDPANPYATSGFNGNLTGGIQLVSLVEYIFLPAVVINTERHGFAGGFNVGQIWAMVSANWKNTLIAAVLVYAAGFVGSLGIIACCVGILVTYPYAVAVNAGIIRYFEATFEPPQQVPQAY
jgi:hypothetical protein